MSAVCEQIPWRPCLPQDLWKPSTSLMMSDTSLLTQQIPVHPSKPTLNVQAFCSFYWLFSITGINYLFIAGPIALENELHRAGIFAGFACNVFPVVHL